MAKRLLVVSLAGILSIACAKGPPDTNEATPSNQTAGNQIDQASARQRGAEVEAKVRRIIAEELGVEEARVIPEATLDEDLGADEIDLADLMSRLEDEFAIPIADEDVEELDTVGSLYKHIKKQIKRKGR